MVVDLLDLLVTRCQEVHRLPRACDHHRALQLCLAFGDEFARGVLNRDLAGRVAKRWPLLFVDPPLGPVLANYGLDNLRFAQPVNPGDSLKVRLTCKQKTFREGMGYGEVRWDTEVTNQDNEIVASYDVLTMVATAETMAELPPAAE